MCLYYLDLIRKYLKLRKTIFTEIRGDMTLVLLAGFERQYLVNEKRTAILTAITNVWYFGENK